MILLPIKVKTLKKLKVLKDNEFIDNKLYYYVKPNDPPAARFYGQTKIHKPGVPMRLMVSYSCSTLHSLNKYIDNILKPDVKYENNRVKSPTTFSNYIRNVPVENDNIMVSFDVTSLYTNIPIIDMLNIIKYYVNNDDQFTRKTTIPQDKFLDLPNLVLTTTWYTFYSQFYQQTDGVEMGSTASPTTAEIYMQAHESTAISTTLHQQLVTLLSFSRFMANLEQPGSRILGAQSVKLTFSLIATFCFTKTENRTKNL